MVFGLCRPKLLLLISCCVFGLHHFPFVAARPDYVDRIPNGRRVYRQGQLWIGVGHESSAGGGPRNIFGADFQASGFAWTSALCERDSDGDGFTNGEELGDPLCKWSSNAGGVLSNGTASHPGFSDSTPVVEERLSRGIVKSPGPFPERETVLMPSEAGVVDGYLVPAPMVAVSTIREPWLITVRQCLEYVQANPFTWSFTVVVPASTNPFWSQASTQSRSDMIYVPYYNLTSFGSQRVLLYLQQRIRGGIIQQHLRLHLRGSLDSATRLFNATEVWGAKITVKGIIADIFCVDRVIALDGANMIRNPEDHTIHCLILDRCIPGGYTILEELDGTPFSSLVTYGPMYNLSTAGNQQVVSWAKGLPMHQKNLRWTATGYLESDGTFELLTFAAPDAILPIYGIVLIAVFAVLLVAGVITVIIVVVRRRNKSVAAPTAEMVGSDIPNGKQQPNETDAKDRINNNESEVNENTV